MWKQVTGYALIFIGLFMLLGFFATGKDAPFLVDLMTFLLFVLAPVAGGLTLIRQKARQRKRGIEEQKKLLDAARQKEVLHFFKAHNGRATVAQIVSETAFDSNDAERALHELIVKGLVEMRTNDHGLVTYELVEPFGDEDLKRRTEDLLQE